MTRSRILAPMQEPVSGLAATVDGARLVATIDAMDDESAQQAGGFVEGVYVFDGRTLAIVTSGIETTGRASAPCFSPRGERFAALAFQGPWVGLTAGTAKVLGLGYSNATSVAFSGDGQALLVGDEQGAITRFSVSGERGGTRLVHRGAITHLKVTKAGGRVVSWSKDGILVVSSAADLSPVASVRLLQGGAAVVTPDGRFDHHGDASRGALTCSAGARSYSMESCEVLHVAGRLATMLGAESSP